MEEQSERIVQFIQSTFEKTGKIKGLVAVSGGIDSAVSLTLATKALGADNVFAILLPYHDQSIDDSRIIANWNGLSTDHVLLENIGPIVDGLASQLGAHDDQMRKGNLMARTRMICIYDWARRLDALVIGTENKSEEKLGYFTRFGDAASDLEPIQHLTKTEVRHLSKALNIPENFRSKAPSAGLWDGQTDETELGFSYEEADLYLNASEAGKESGLSKEVVEKIEARILSQAFKHEVPYHL